MATKLEPARLTTLDTLYVEIPISAIDKDTKEPVDLSGDSPQLAWLQKGQQPAEADWHNATWDAAAEYARVLVGPAGDVQYPAGRYVSWWRMADNPEFPARPAPYPGAPPTLIITEV